MPVSHKIIIRQRRYLCMGKLAGLIVFAIGAVIFFWETPVFDFLISIGFGLDMSEIRFFCGLALMIIGMVLLVRR